MATVSFALSQLLCEAPAATLSLARGPLGSGAGSRSAPRVVARGRGLAVRGAASGGPKDAYDSDLEQQALKAGEWPSRLVTPHYESLTKHLQDRSVSTKAAVAAGQVAGAAEAESTPYESDAEMASLKSGEWPSTLIMHHFDGVAKHLKSQPTPALDLHQEPEGGALEPDESHGVVSAEWSMNLSILSWEDLHEFFHEQLFKSSAKPDSLVSAVMKRDVRTARPENTVAEVAHLLEEFSGLPVVDGEGRCVGVLSRTDLARGKGKLGARVGDLMTSPPSTIMRPSKTVLFAATLMLKNKVHRIPIVDENDKLVGIVTRSDIFTVLEANN